MTRLRVAALLLTGLCAASAVAQPSAAPSAAFGYEPASRIRIAINDGWTFLPDDAANAEAAECEDATWSRVDLPHTWNAEDPFDDVPEYRRGVSWYRRPLNLGEQFKGKRLFLYFEGVHQKAEVFVNGQPAGSHKGGYTAFCLDITALVKPDGRNVLAVKADNSHDESIIPLDIGYAFYGGIYRDVWLIATDPVHFQMLDRGSPGVFIDTPQVSTESATVRIRGTLINEGGEAGEASVQAKIVDPKGLVIRTYQQNVNAAAGQPTEFKLTGEPITAPQLWSPETPNLYRVELSIRRSDKPLDQLSQPLGLRWFSFDADQGFILNGKPYALRGASRHQDFEGLGSALPNRMHRNDLQWLKDMGGNFLRLAHYPQEDEVLKAADELGLIVWEEIPIVSTMNGSPEFAATARTMLTEMIRQHHNHPSVVLWGYMNEVLLNWGRTKEKDPKFIQDVLKLARELEALARQEDPTRCTVMAMDARLTYDEQGISDIAMVAGWNIYNGWYSEGWENFGKFLDNQHKKHPQRKLIVSEYGAGSDLRLHSLKPVRFDHTTEWMCAFHEAHLRQIKARPWLCGTLIWNQFDFSQPKAGDSIAHVNQKGMLTWDRRPKDVYFMYQANLAKRELVYIGREWSRRTGSDAHAERGAGPQPVTQPVKVYATYPEVDLYLNGQQVGTAKPDDVHAVTFQVPFVQGWNNVEAVGRGRGEPMHDLAKIHFDYRAARLADPSVPFEELAVNVGADCQFTDSGGLVWEADQAYTEGAFGYVGGLDRYSADKGASRASGDILGTLDDPLYQLWREGLSAYRMDVPDGDYELELCFTEYSRLKAGERIFSVNFNGRPLIERMDLFAEYGYRRAVPKLFRVRVTGGQGATVGFEPIEGKPVLSGIRLHRVG